MNVTKYEYTVDPNHKILLSAANVERALAQAPAILVEAAKELVSKDSSAQLYVVSRNGAISELLGLVPDLGGPDEESRALNALFWRSSLVELARRYRNNELPEELRGCGVIAYAWATAQVAATKQPATAASESDEHLIGQPNDGIIA